MEASNFLWLDAPCSSHTFVALTALKDLPNIFSPHYDRLTSVASVALNPIPKMTSDGSATTSSRLPRYSSCLRRSRLSASSERNLWTFALFAILLAPERSSAIRTNRRIMERIDVRRYHDFSSKPLMFSPKDIMTSILCSYGVLSRHLDKYLNSDFDLL
jgi:hypothetical protein